MSCKKIASIIIILTFTSFILAKEVNVYFLLHGLYSTNYYWKSLIKSKDFRRAGFTFAGNFDVDEELIEEDKYIITDYLNGDLADQLKNKNNLVYTIKFSSGFRKNFHQQAEQVAMVLDKFPDEDNFNYYLVGHSMGGLAARCYLTSIHNRNIKGLVTIGTPNLGSYLGHASRGLTGFIGRMFELVERPDNLLTGVSYLWKDNHKNVTPSLSPNSKELNRLNSLSFPDSVKAISIFFHYQHRERDR
jgi:pimeloyl-ACP methyl ester carboxylesterase